VGTSTSPAQPVRARFPGKNAAQPVFGESEILRTTDLGATWSRVAMPPRMDLRGSVRRSNR
jgi:photosystem II stability/assembly factor-like uncharacterized protein